MNRILFLVDQNLTVRMFYQEKLSLLGLEVLASSDRDLLSARIDHHRPDIIVTDIQRWETIKVDPTCHYDMRYMDSGYVIAQRSDARGLNIILKVFGEKAAEHLELILFKGEMRTQFPSEDRKLGELGLPGNVSLVLAAPKGCPEIALLH